MRCRVGLTGGGKNFFFLCQKSDLICFYRVQMGLFVLAAALKRSRFEGRRRRAFGLSQSQRRMKTDQVEKCWIYGRTQGGKSCSCTCGWAKALMASESFENDKSIWINLKLRCVATMGSLSVSHTETTDSGMAEENLKQKNYFIRHKRQAVFLFYKQSGSISLIIDCQRYRSRVDLIMARSWPDFVSQAEK